MVRSADILNAQILIVDDKEANVRLLEGMLRCRLYVASIHDGPDEVCELHRRNRYVLILLDLQMPGMDGFQVMEGLKEIEEDGYLPVLVITAQPAISCAPSKPAPKILSATVRSGRAAGARSQHSGSAPVAPGNQEVQQGAGETIRELEASREVIRLKTLEEQKKSEQELALAQQTQESLLPRCPPEFENSVSMLSTVLRAMWEAISTISCN